MANSQISTSVTGTTVKFYINIGIGDPLKWTAYVWAQHDHGKGAGGSNSNYPYVVESFSGSDTQIVTQNYIQDNYLVELSLDGIGIIDTWTFSVSTSSQAAYACNPNTNKCDPSTCTPNNTTCFSDINCGGKCAASVATYACDTNNQCNPSTCSPVNNTTCFSSSDCNKKCPSAGADNNYLYMGIGLVILLLIMSKSKESSY